MLLARQCARDYGVPLRSMIQRKTVTRNTCLGLMEQIAVKINGVIVASVSHVRIWGPLTANGVIGEIMEIAHAHAAVELRKNFANATIRRHRMGEITVLASVLNIKIVAPKNVRRRLLIFGKDQLFPSYFSLSEILISVTKSIN